MSHGTILAFGALIGMPSIFAATGIIIGTIEAMLYTMFAKVSGGLRIDLER